MSLPLRMRWALFVGCLALCISPTWASPALPLSPAQSNETVGPDDFSKILRPVIPGTDPIFGVQDVGASVGVIELTRRDCLPNGTNFCFGNTVDSCPSCGTCCTTGTYCCASDQTCCGTGGCCGSGETCVNGQCSASIVTVTITSTIFQTVSHVATKMATVFQAEVDTSTIVSTVVVTVSSADTQTSVVWVTSTVFAKRDSGYSPLLGERDEIAALRALGLRNPQLSDNELDERGYPAAALGVRATGDSTTTVTASVTSTTDVTSFVSATVTAPTTSLVLTTVFQTVTTVLNAGTTITVTSTFTLTSHSRTTETITETASDSSTSSTDNTSTSSTSSSTSTPGGGSSSGLSKGAIGGIAAGGAVALILVLAGIFLLIRRRRNNGSGSGNDYYYDPHDVSPMREPTVPSVLPQFVPHPEHHGDQFVPPTNNAGAAYLSPDDQRSPTGSGHERSSSGFTTLVGTPNPAGKKPDRTSVATSVSGHQRVPSGSAAEVEGRGIPHGYEMDATHPVGSPVPEGYEMDGAHPVGSPGQQSPPQAYRQPQQQGNYYRTAQSPYAEEMDANETSIAELGSGSPVHPPQSSPHQQSRYNDS